MTFKVNMKGNISIKRRIIVNGREYSSVEEIPEDLRRAYEQAFSKIGHEGHGIYPGGPQPQIVFNGREYEDVDDMPEDVRRLYSAAMMTVEAQGSLGVGVTKARERVPTPPGPEGSASPPPPSMKPIEVGGGSTRSLSRLVTVGIMLLVLLGGLYYLSRVLLTR